MTCDTSMHQRRPQEIPRLHEVQRRTRSVGARRYEHLFPKTSVHPHREVTDEGSYLSAVQVYLSTRKGAYKRFVHLIQRMKNASAKVRKDSNFEETFKKIVALLWDNLELIRQLHFVLPTCYLYQVQNDAIIVKVRNWVGQILKFS